MSAGAASDERFYLALLEDDPSELYENAPCGYLSALPDGTIIKVNETFLAWTRYRAADLVGTARLHDLMPPGDRIFYETHVAPGLRMQGTMREIAVEIVCEPGERLPVLVNAVLQRDDDGEPRTIRMAIFDATERRAYERELLTARRRAEESEARATELARTLQASFLPPASFVVPGLDVAGAYRPAGDGTEVGGDFYDAFETAAGTWGLVLGDVCGKGASAAVLTSLARYTIRAGAMRATQPSEVLRMVHEAFLRDHPDQFCTAVFAFVDPSSGVVRLACGGHHLPLRVRPDGETTFVGAPGTLLGLIDEPRLVDTEVALAPGDALVLYTDGVVEGRRGGEFFDDDRIARTLRGAAGCDARTMAEALVDASVTFQDGTTRDDIAVLIVRNPA